MLYNLIFCGINIYFGTEFQILGFKLREEAYNKTKTKRIVTIKTYNFHRAKRIYQTS